MTNKLNYDEAIKLMESLKEQCIEEVGIFVDYGWGDDPTFLGTFDIIIDGNGHKSFGCISKETYKKLVNDGIIKCNSYIGYKKRFYHVYCTKY